MQGSVVTDDFGDVPVGLTGFDEWMMKLLCIMMVSGLLEIEVGCFDAIDRDHWHQYYDAGYTPQEAFEEDLTAYGD